MKILIDNGHGANTQGKRSPDGRLREYAWTREIASRIVTALKERGYNASRIVTEENDVTLGERCRRVNEICRKEGASNCILVSVHINAASSGSWTPASGWSGWVAIGSSPRSKRLAQLLYAEAEKRNLKGNRSVPREKYWVAGFYILRNTLCPAVLTENLFMDNRENYQHLLSETGKQEIVDLHVEGIINYIKEKL